MNPNEKNGYYFFAQKTGITLKIYKINFFAVNQYNSSDVFQGDIVAKVAENRTNTRHTFPDT